MNVKKQISVIAAIAIMCSTLSSCGLGGYGMGGFGGYGMGMGVPGLPYYLQPNVALQNSVNQINSNMQQAAASGMFTPAPVTSTSSSYSGSTSTATTNKSSSSTQQKRDGLCPTCCGDGKCYQCHGSGMRTDNMFGTGTSSKVKCGICGGDGKCKKCYGRGRI